MDGITHVNIYSRGDTSIGCKLSHFTHRPFRFMDINFASLEACWHFLKVYHGCGYMVHTLNTLHGREALYLGRTLRKHYLGEHFKDDLPRFYSEFYKAALTSIQQDPILVKDIKELPLTIYFDHYYVNDKGIVRPRGWMDVTGIYESIRLELL